MKRKKIEQLQRNDKVAYIRSWQKEDVSNHDSKYNKVDNIKKIGIGSVFDIKYKNNQNYKVAYDCSEYMLDGKPGDKWNYFWGGDYGTDSQQGDRFYIIMVYRRGYSLDHLFFRMQLRDIPLVEVIEGEDFEYIRDRLNIFLSNEEIAQMLQFEETGVVELNIEENNNELKL